MSLESMISPVALLKPQRRMISCLQLEMQPFYLDLGWPACCVVGELTDREAWPKRSPLVPDAQWAILERGAEAAGSAGGGERECVVL